jgi:hypothetical protein
MLPAISDIAVLDIRTEYHSLSQFLLESPVVGCLAGEVGELITVQDNHITLRQHPHSTRHNPFTSFNSSLT